MSLVADLSRERSDGGPPSEPLVAKRHKVSVEEVESAEKVVTAYQEMLAVQTREQLKKVARYAGDGKTFSLTNSKVGFTGFSGSDLGPYTANFLIMVRACNTDADFNAQLEKAVQDPIGVLPPEASGYIARVGYNDEWSCTGWLDQTATYDRAANTVNVQ